MRRPLIFLATVLAFPGGVGFCGKSFLLFQTSPGQFGESKWAGNWNLAETKKETQIEYRNTQYGFTFALPESWKGYSIIMSKWTGWILGAVGDQEAEQGPMLSIRNPKWTNEVPCQDVQIMIFTVKQWRSLQEGKFTASAAPIGPAELGHNSKYVFALSPRYNYSFLPGYEEVEKILRENSLHAF